MPDEHDTDNIHEFDKEPSGAEQTHDSPDEQVDEPQSESVATAATPAVENPSAPVTQEPVLKSIPSNTPGVLILQWLTYAFWGWTLVALYWLVSVTVGYLVALNSDNSSGEESADLSSMLAYPLAAVLVLFVIAMVCDIFYRRLEPVRKTGAAMVIMIIHVVIFALAGIGSLIVGVFALVSMLISTDTNEFATSSMITAGIMTVAYGATFLRTLRPARLNKVAVSYWVFMIILTVVTLGVSIFGPLAHAQLTKNDRLIEEGLGGVAGAVANYTQENNQLPSSLAQVKVSSYQTGASQLIKKDLVQYTPKERLDTVSPSHRGASGTGFDINKPSDSNSVYHYVLCVTYKAAKHSRYTNASPLNRGQRYRISPDTSSHEVGKVCYDLQTEYIYTAY